MISAVSYLEQVVKLFEAREDWQKASEISQQLNDESAIVRNRIYQAEALQQLGLYDRSCRLLQSALALDSNSCADLTTQTLENKIENVSPLQITGWRSLGNVLRLLGKLEESELVLQTIAQSSSDTEPAATRISLGNTLRARGNLIRDRQAAPKYNYLPSLAL